MVGESKLTTNLEIAIKEVGRLLDNNPKILGEHIFKIAKDHDIAPRDLHFAIRNKLMGIEN